MKRAFKNVKYVFDFQSQFLVPKVGQNFYKDVRIVHRPNNELRLKTIFDIQYFQNCSYFFVGSFQNMRDRSKKGVGLINDFKLQSQKDSNN